MLYVSATLLRRAGRRLADDEQSVTVEGVLTITSQRGLTAEIRPPMTMSSEPLATLHDVRLLGVTDGLRLRGYERHGDAAVLQEWDCKLIDTSHGIDSRTLRPLPCPERR